MFDFDVSHVIGGVNIDRPFNAMTLTADLHQAFGAFNIYFDPLPDRAHTYQIRTFLPAGLVEGVPVTRTLHLRNDIDPPSPRLLAIHSAIAHILHLSGAGEYICRILHDMEELAARAEGGLVELGRMVTLRLRGWQGVTST
jgi:hypothetical protein